MDLINVTTVDFCGNGDGITAIYLNGKLHKYGDYYHNKIKETDNQVRFQTNNSVYQLSINVFSDID